jgi:hypothetical protein
MRLIHITAAQNVEICIFAFGACGCFNGAPFGEKGTAMYCQ